MASILYYMTSWGFEIHHLSTKQIVLYKVLPWIRDLLAAASNKVRYYTSRRLDMFHLLTKSDKSHCYRPGFNDQRLAQGAPDRLEAY